MEREIIIGNVDVKVKSYDDCYLFEFSITSSSEDDTREWKTITSYSDEQLEDMSGRDLLIELNAYLVDCNNEYEEWCLKREKAQAIELGVEYDYGHIKKIFDIK